MKAAILSITRDVHIVDITHEVAPHAVLEGALALEAAAPRFPSATIHVAVVDPGVGTARRGLAVASGDQVFIGPDNGLFTPFLGPAAGAALGRARGGERGGRGGLAHPPGDRGERGERRDHAGGAARQGGCRKSDFVAGGEETEVVSVLFPPGLFAGLSVAFSAGLSVVFSAGLSAGFSDDFSDCRAFLRDSEG